MQTFKRISLVTQVIAIVMTLIPDPPASAQCRTIVNRGVVVNQCAPAVAVKQQQAVVVKELAVAQFLAVPVVVPAAFATYVPSVYQQTEYVRAQSVAQPYQACPTCETTSKASKHDDRVSALEAKLDKLIDVLSRNAGGGTVTASTSEASGFAKVLQSKCASCHSEATAQAKGGKFVLFSGGGLSAKLTAVDAARIGERIADGTMPPAGHAAVSDDDYAQYPKWLVSFLKGQR